MTDATPIHREVLVEAVPALAFSVFTEQISTWWPLANFSVHGKTAAVAFVDGEIVETAPGHPDAHWGTVTAWEPPARLSFTWHPGAEPERASRVNVTFAAVGGHTLVRLEHSGWEVYADPAKPRTEYDQGWPIVLESLGRVIADLAGESTWVALLHRPAALTQPGRTVFEDPRFGDHVAFLARMREAGYLVAAGSLADESGAGMTILRLPGADRLDDATRLATVEDVSVAGGLFTVTVRPWNVVMHA